MDEPVQATLTDPDGGFTGKSWTWEALAGGSSLWSPISGATTDRYTPTASDLRKQLRARVSYRDGHGAHTDTAESAASAAVAISNAHAPTISGPDSVSYAENDTVAVGTYTASDADGHPIEWLALGGAHRGLVPGVVQQSIGSVCGAAGFSEGGRVQYRPCPCAGAGSCGVPRTTQRWMALAHARSLKVELHSWQQPPAWRSSSRNYWARTFEAEDTDLFT
ncbi:MAG: hypothetical protein OXH50_16935 [Gemmatimonadetes bacterium]|nr:hypothetical protein [Gemmatimonadota bacterium]